MNNSARLIRQARATSLLVVLPEPHSAYDCEAEDQDEGYQFREFRPIANSRCHGSRFAIENFTRSNRIRNRNSQPIRSESRSEISIDRFFPPSQILLLVLTCPRPLFSCGAWGWVDKYPKSEFHLEPVSGGQHTKDDRTSSWTLSGRLCSGIETCHQSTRKMSGTYVPTNV